jgi:hypothetical protein
LIDLYGLMKVLFVIYHNSNSHIRGNFGGCDLLLVLLPQHTSIETCEAMGGLVVYVPPAVVWLVCHHETCGDGLSYRSCCPQNQGGVRAQLFQMWLPERRETRIRHRRDRVSVDEFRKAGLQLGEEGISLAGHVVKERK